MGWCFVRRLTSLDDVTIEDLEAVLRAWRDGELKFVEAQGWAEVIFAADNREYIPEYAENDPRSVVIEVMTLLNWMYSTHVMRRDTPMLLEFLERFKQDPHAAWEYYQEASKVIDSKQRRDLPFE